MQTILSVLHVIACVFLILVVLLQQGKGGGMGSAFGGAGQQVFGGSGAGNLLTKLTAAFASVFMITSVSLAYIASAGDTKLKAAASKNPNATVTTMLPAASAPAPAGSGNTPGSAPTGSSEN
jgi:preprotein translocase subunit SecG